MRALWDARPDARLCRCLHNTLRAEVEAYVQAGIAPATKRAYRADLDHFEAWGGTIPATDALVAAYLADHAAVLKVSTLTRRLAAVSIAHDARDLPNPVRTPLVRATMRGIRREHGAAQRQAKPLLREDLFVVLGAMGDRLKDLRDRALLLIGFAGGLRRSELAAINLIDFERVREGIILTIRRSKTDQDGVGRKIGIPFGRTIHCPVRALENWLSAARIEDGPVFRPVDRHGRVSASHPGCVVPRRRGNAAEQPLDRAQLHRARGTRAVSERSRDTIRVTRDTDPLNPSATEPVPPCEPSNSWASGSNEAIENRTFRVAFWAVREFSGRATGQRHPHRLQCRLTTPLGRVGDKVQSPRDTRSS